MPKPCQLPDKDDSLSDRVIGDQVRLLAINQLDERLERYRLAQPKLEQQMLKSLRDYGQLSPVSAAGNRIAKRLGFLLDSLAKMNTWL